MMGYRSQSAYSPPEVLELKRMPEPKPEMDIYSYGMILWEVFHGAQPFDGNIKLAQNYVCNEDSRPMIEEQRISAQMAAVVRKCWAKDPDERPSTKWLLLNLR